VKEEKLISLELMVPNDQMAMLPRGFNKFWRWVTGSQMTATIMSLLDTYSCCAGFDKRR
jgi:hypothetical protein